MSKSTVWAVVGVVVAALIVGWVIVRRGGGLEQGQVVPATPATVFLGYATLLEEVNTGIDILQDPVNPISTYGIRFEDGRKEYCQGLSGMQMGAIVSVYSVMGSRTTPSVFQLCLL